MLNNALTVSYSINISFFHNLEVDIQCTVLSNIIVWLILNILKLLTNELLYTLLLEDLKV